MLAAVHNHTMNTATTTAPWGGWFDLGHCHGMESLRQLPAECIADCSGPGPADDSVAYWCKRLAFDGPSWLFRSHLREYGAWDSSELADHNENRQRVLWIWANNCSENPGLYDYLYLGV
jgi:hypothetical protein